MQEAEHPILNYQLKVTDTGISKSSKHFFGLVDSCIPLSGKSLFSQFKMAAAAKKQAKGGVRLRGVGPDGLPRLPPIEKPMTREDPFAKSKLMTFRMAKHKQDLLKKIM